MLFMGQIDVQQ